MNLVLLHAVHASTTQLFQSGDLVFVRPYIDAASALDSAIADVGAATIAWLRDHGTAVASNETAVHVAIAWRNASAGGALSFIEATPPMVRLTPAAMFWRGWPSAAFFHGRLRNGRARAAGQRAAALALSMLGVRYSEDFGPPPREFYCSSLVRWAYLRATGDSHVFIDERTFPLIFVPRAFWEKYYRSRNETLPPPNTTGSNPTLLLHSPHVSFTPFQPPRLLAATPGDDPHDLLSLSVNLDGATLWPPGRLGLFAGGMWRSGSELRALAESVSTVGSDALGAYVRRARMYALSDVSAEQSGDGHGGGGKGGGGVKHVVELSVRSYSSGNTLVYEQRFPYGWDGGTPSSTPHDSPPAELDEGTDAGPGANGDRIRRVADGTDAATESTDTTGASGVSGVPPMVSWPAFELGALSRSTHWRSWHGAYGSFQGTGLGPNDTLVFNGSPTMPLLFWRAPLPEAPLPEAPLPEVPLPEAPLPEAPLPEAPPPSPAGVPAVAVVVSPLCHFNDHSQAAVVLTTAPTAAATATADVASVSWRLGSSHRFGALPTNFSVATILVAARGQTAAMARWGAAMRAWYRTDRRAALEADVTTQKIGYWTDNGVFFFSASLCALPALLTRTPSCITSLPPPPHYHPLHRCPLHRYPQR